MRIAIVGYGRMGRAIAALAPARGHEIALVVDEAENPDGDALTPERLAGIDAAIEFTTPTTAPMNLARLVEACIPPTSRSGCSCSFARPVSSPAGLPAFQTSTPSSSRSITQRSSMRLQERPRPCGSVSGERIQRANFPSQ